MKLLQQGKACHWRNPNNSRYYAAILTKNLFQEWVIIKAWGGNRGGQVRHSLFENFDAAYKELEKLKKFRERRGCESI